MHRNTHVGMRLCTLRSLYTLSALCLALTLMTSLTANRVAAQVGCDYPRTLLILDRSTSMNGQINGQSKWDIATGAIGGMLTNYSESIHFGLMLYPGPSGRGADGVTGDVGACRRNLSDDTCAPQAPLCSTGEVVVGIGPNSAPLIEQELELPVGSSSYTPTWQSLEKASTYAPLVQGAHDKFAILITDGWQCCGYYQDNGQGRCESAGSERSIPVEKVTLLRAQGVRVFVIGFGGSVDVQTLQDMALEAGTARPSCDPSVTDVTSPQLCYYQASDSDSLNTLLSELARQIAEEVCDGIDNDCDGRTDEGLRQACSNSCGAGESVCVSGQWGECNVPSPGAESCNGVDDDCDGQVDEALSRRCESACGVGEELCREGTWEGCTAPPPSAEICNALDDNCDGRVDEGCECLDGERQACGGDVGSCAPGVQVCRGERWGACEGAIMPGDEMCNGLDDDCDGKTDELAAQDCSTACGAGSIECVNGRWSECSAPSVGVESCNGLDDDCDGVSDEGDLCQAEGGACLCGGCALPCTNGECFETSQVCTMDHCVTDLCPEGTYCLETACIEGDSPFDDAPISMDPMMPSDMTDPVNSMPMTTPTSSCETSSRTPFGHQSWWLLIALFGLGWIRTRPRVSHI